jgi:glycosyltransferase 2 family protein
MAYATGIAQQEASLHRRGEVGDARSAAPSEGQARGYAAACGPSPRNGPQGRPSGGHPSPRKAGRGRRNFQLLAGLACTLVFLAFALSRVPLSAVRAAVINAQLDWVAAAILVYAVNLALRAWRWQMILRPVAMIPYPTMAKALVVGYGVNTVIPARLGELFRAEFLSRDVGLSRVSALTSIIVERVFDGLAVVACLGLGLLLTAATRHGSEILTEVLVTGGALFAAILLCALWLSGPLAPRLAARFPRLGAHIATMRQALAILRTRRTIAVAAMTLIICVPDALSLWLVVKAVGQGLGFADTLVLLGAASLSTLLPSGPAFLGTLQFAYALALGFAGVPSAVGIAAATLSQVCILLPVGAVSGGVLLHSSGSALRWMLVQWRCNEAPRAITVNQNRAA